MHKLFFIAVLGIIILCCNKISNFRVQNDKHVYQSQIMYNELTTVWAMGYAFILQMTSNDKDFRFMATNDLMTELQKDSIKLDDDSERKVKT